MHPRISEILDDLHARRADLRAALDSIPYDQRTRRPAADRWSAADVLEHLAKVEERMVRGIFEKRIAEARAAGVGPEHDTAPVTPTFDAAGVLDRSVTRAAPDAVAPGGATDADAAWAELERVRARLRDVLLSADGLALGDVIHAHSTLGTMNLYQWALWIGGHEARHAAQVREIARAIAAA